MPDAGVRLVVEGEKEFKAAIAQCDAAVKENQKSLKLLTEEYKLNETGMKDASSGFGSMADAAAILADKGRVLADSIAVQTEKVDLLDLRVKEAAEAYGEHDRRTEALRSQLLDASTALTKMTAEQEKNRQAMLDAENSTAEYDRAVADLTAAISANDAELKTLGGGVEALRREYADLEKGTGSLEKSTGSLEKSTGSLEGGAGGLKSAFEVLGKTFGAVGDSEETLRKKTENLEAQNESLKKQNETLNDSISKQKEITEALAKAQEVTAKRYGEGSKEAEAYRKKVADATAQLDAMEQELKENEAAIESNVQAVRDGGDAPNGMLEGLKQIEELTGIKIPKGIETMIGGFDGGTLAVGGIVTALGAVAQKMEAVWQESIAWAKDVTTESAELDLSTEQYQELDYIASATGTSVNSLTSALSKISTKAGEAALKQEELRYKIAALQEEMDEAQKSREYWSERYVSSGFDDAFTSQIDLATKRYNEAKTAIEELSAESNEATNYFDDLGISIYDTNGKLKDSLTLLYELIDVYAGVESEAVRNYNMQELLGKSYKSLKPFVDEGANSLRRIAQEGRDAGAIVGEDYVEALNKAGIAEDLYHKKQEATVRNFQAQRAESENLIDWLNLVADQWAQQGANFFEHIFTKFSGHAHASGTMYAPGGYSLVGERGPEIVELPRGSKVFPNGMTPAGFGGGTTVNESSTYNVVIDASRVQDFNDMIRIAQNARVGMRRG